MFEDISAEFGDFRLQAKRPYGRGRGRNGRGRGRSPGRRRGGKRKEQATGTNTYELVQDGGNFRPQNSRRRRRSRRGGRRRGGRKQGGGRGRKLSAEEKEMVNTSDLSIDAPKFSSAYEWKPPMFLSPFVAKTNPDTSFELNPLADEFIPKNE